MVHQKKLVRVAKATKGIRLLPSIPIQALVCCYTDLLLYNMLLSQSLTHMNLCVESYVRIELILIKKGTLRAHIDGLFRTPVPNGQGPISLAL